jgi:hypothetical protein
MLYEYHPVMKISHLIFFLFYPTIFISAQPFDISQYRGELNIKLEVLDEKRMEKGIETLNQANMVEAEALNILKSMPDTELIEGASADYKKMIKKLLEASGLYQEGHVLIYTVYNENCEKFLDEMRKMNHYAAGMNKAKYYEQKAESTMKRAENIRELLLEADKPEWMQYKMHEALVLEKLAIRDKGRALQIYEDFPVEYNYAWDNDVTPDELAKFYNNPVVNLPPEEVFKKNPKDEQKEPEGGKIIFRVQIAAHTVVLEPDYIKTFYTGKDSVIQIKEGQWYKYQIGSFDNFQDANKLRINSRVPRAFVVAYQGDRKLTIKQALSLLQSVQ